MSQLSRYHRVVIDDSSSDNDISSDTDKFKTVDKTQDNSSDEENINGSICNLSRMLGNLRFMRRNYHGQRVDQTDDETTSTDEDTYIEDSFLVKDDSYFKENMIVSNERYCDDRKTVSTITIQQGKGDEKREKSTKISTVFKSSVLDGSFNGNNNISTLFELYPELKGNLGTEHSELTSNSLRMPHTVSIGEDEKFENFLEDAETSSFTAGAYRIFDSDCSISDEFDGDGQRLNEVKILENSENGTVGSHIKTTRNDRNDNPERWYLSATKEKGKQKEVDDVLLEYRYASDIQKKDQQNDDEIFLLALSPKGPEHQNAQKYNKSKFTRIREKLTKTLFVMYNKRCFDNKLNPNMVVKWNTRLRRTAGRCHSKRDGTAYIELSTKVCDTPERLRDTLLHELCHAAVWVIDRIFKGGHGVAWKYWVYRCQKAFPSLPLVEKCHNYIIDAKYLYICLQCGQMIKRHSKSLNADRQICGICRGNFILRTRDGKQISTRPANTFAQFVKENYGKEKKPGMKHADIMKILSRRFKARNDPMTEPNEVMSSKDE